MKKYGFYIFMILYSIVIGVLLGTLIPFDFFTQGIWTIGVLVVGLSVGFILQTLIHEGGHLLFGLLTGYQFVSYRFFSWMIIKKDGKLEFKRYSLAGTAGQCLLSPPERVNGQYPIFLYNMGGVTLNIVSAVLFLVIGKMLFKTSEITGIIFLLISIAGISMAFENGFPLKTKEVTNDGYNAMSLLKHPKDLEAYWKMLKINALQIRGVHLNDVDDEYFYEMSDIDSSSTLQTGVVVFSVSRKIEKKEYEKAVELIEQLLKSDVNIVGINRNLLIDEKAFFLLCNNEYEKAKELFTKPQIQFNKLMKQYPSVIRCQYTFALSEKNDKEAQKLKEKFEKIARNYPYEIEIETERELIKYAEEKTASYSVSEREE